MANQTNFYDATISKGKKATRQLLLAMQQIPNIQNVFQTSNT